MAGLQTSAPPILSSSRIGTNDVKTRVAGIRQVGGTLAGLTADAFDVLQDGLNGIQSVLRKSTPTLQELTVTDSEGQLIGWIGNRVVGDNNYFGGYLKQLYVGGTSPLDAPLFADHNGNVIVGKNGSISIQNTLGTQKGYLGVKVEMPIQVSTVVAATDGTIQVTTTADHGYVTGDSVIASLPGVGVVAAGVTVFPPFDAPITVIDTRNFTLDNTTFAGGYTTGGTVFRYYGGIWAQSAAFGGTGFMDAPIRAFADGQVVISNATIDLVVAGGGDEVLIGPKNTGGDIIIYSTGRSRPATYISAGLIRVQDVALNTTTISSVYIDAMQLNINAVEAIASDRSATLKNVSASGNLAVAGPARFTNSGIGLMQLDGSGLLGPFQGVVALNHGGTGSATQAGAQFALGVYSTTQVDNLLAQYARHGNYNTDTALSGEYAHFHAVAI